MKRPTIADLARHAGVGVATVDRVLTGRRRVREETARKVWAAAEEIGFHGANAIRSRVFADRPAMRLGVILQKERHAFYADFARELEAAARRFPDANLRLSLEFTATSEPGELAERLLRLGGRVQAIAATGADHHDVTAAVAALRARGVPTFALLSDFAQGLREAYVGLNNMKVGRTAAWLMSKAAVRPGKVAVFIGGHRYHGHALREAGFRACLREYAPEFEVLDAIVTLETRQLTREALLGLLSRHEDLVGVYCAGGGMEGVIAALREAERGADIACLVNELTPDSRQALMERRITGIFQTPLPALCAELVSAMARSVGQGPSDTPGQRFVDAALWIPESL
ncbi:LacI family DNA-binding transcriptional regulator [Amaricoccus solimangrovi]|uniref:LacI family transcriptional regulator n=1 Tax=Amaricoccus solimangrovi TaxID=2589815 RepID=A0A501WUE3_9RHOB|nr:LacI family DNA-binding transcriptional regulator [Amaricoccus solimangrovi]TPE50997.1 LacI family transcriptional regulator [Amaricoccus solimangrovi]